MPLLRLTLQTWTLFAYMSICTALFYTNSKENDYPRIGKRFSFILDLNGQNDRKMATESDTDLQDPFDKYPYEDPIDGVDLLPEEEMIPETDNRDAVITTSFGDSRQSPSKQFFVLEDGRDTNNGDTSAVLRVIKAYLARRHRSARYHP